MIRNKKAGAKCHLFAQPAHLAITGMKYGLILSSIFGQSCPVQTMQDARHGMQH